MAGRASAFAVLGLPPGADPTEVEQAYKRLIKQHHPDREGGDPSRAAEINRAYRELRGRAPPDPLEFNSDDGPLRRRRWPGAALIGGAVIGGAIVGLGPSVPRPTLWPIEAHLPVHHSTARAAPDPIAAELHAGVIDDAVADAIKIYRRGDESALAAASRACQQQFREEPGTRMLDRCAAFDDAVIGLQDRDPLRDSGPFAPLAVTGRQWSAASVLSDDSLAIDSRLDQIRLKVDLALAPHVAPIAPPAKDLVPD
jgi:hypothetical protein